jgi:nitrate reductase NapAB chaperone NapD
MNTVRNFAGNQGESGMIVKSFLVFPHSGRYLEAFAFLSRLDHVEVSEPSNSEAVLIVVAEHRDTQSEADLMASVEGHAAVDHLVLVSSFTSDNSSE